ncbi:MAG: MBL fold metallo-hydrolase [Clostridia bacterium]|nr:MBL fold metallo-hydrolase [Clostridia bacterium]
MKIKRLILGALETNCYVLTDENTGDCVIIDPAYNAQQVVDYLSDNHLTPIAILLTHGHFDHCGGVSCITDKYDVPVYCHNLDVAMAHYAQHNEYSIPARNCDVTNPFDNEDDICVGNYHISVMHTPGHTPGSVCYFVYNYMFSGDTLFAGSIGRTDLAQGNPKQMIDSLCRIARIKADYIMYPGHDISSTLSNEQANNMYLAGVIRFD